MPSGSWGSYVPVISSTVANAFSGAVDIASAVSSSVSTQWTAKASPDKQTPSDRDEVVWVGFDSDEGAASNPQFLNVCFSNGFQVWEVMDSMPDSTEATRQTQPLRELASVRQGYTKLIKVLQSSPVSDRSPLYGMQPAVAVVGGNTDDDLKVLQIYSLREASYVYSLRFHGEVHGVVSSPIWFAVCLKNQVILHSLETFDAIQTFTTYPCPTSAGVFAIGPRSFAYASNQPLRSDIIQTAPSNTYGSALIDAGVGVAGTARNAARQIGGMGLRALDAYLSCSPPLAHVPEATSEYAGCVMIRSMETAEAMHHFRAHDGPLSFVKFDASGTLLVTAAVDGHNLNLFRVEGCNTPRHLYKLVRGVTSTIIQDVSFSPDNKFIAVTSGRGTSHVFAISVEGSQASVETHVNDGGMSLVDTPPSTPPESQQARPPTTVFTLLRMKAHTHNGGSSSGPPPPANGSGQCCARYTSDGRAVYMVSGEGVLTLYDVAPVAKVDEETQQEVLSLETECQGTFNICRRQHWGEQRASQERLAHWSNGAARVPIAAGHAAKSTCVPLTEQQAAELVCLEMEGGEFCLIEEGTPDTRPTTHVRAMAAAAAATISGKGSSQDAWDDDWEEDGDAPAPAAAPEKAASSKGKKPSKREEEEEEDIFAFSGGEGMLDGLDDEGEHDDDGDWGVEEGGGASAAAMSAARSSQDKVMSEEGSGAGSKMSRDSSSKDDNNKVDGGDASMARGGWSSMTDSGKEDDVAGCLAEEEKNLYGSSLSLKASSTSKGFNAIVAMEANHQSLKESLSNAKACGGGDDDGKDTPEPVEEPVAGAALMKAAYSGDDSDSDDAERGGGGGGGGSKKKKKKKKKAKK